MSTKTRLERNGVYMEIVNDAKGFLHRLSDGKETTAWASYESSTYLKGVVGVTPYWTGHIDAELLTADQFAQVASVKKIDPGPNADLAMAGRKIETVMVER